MEGDWKMFNGESASYFSWGVYDSYQEPDGGSIQNHVSMITAKGASGNWRSPGEWLDVELTSPTTIDSYCTFEPIQTTEQFCLALKNEYTDGASTNEIQLIYNDFQIHRFITGVDDPPKCLPKNQMDIANDIFTFKSTGDGVI